MCVVNTPVEDYTRSLGLHVKREDLCCPSGPHFSKTRGVYAHIKSRPEKTIGVLDTSHSQGGWAVAQACKFLGKQCILYYPVRKADRDNTMDWNPEGKGLWGDVLKPQQAVAAELGASLIPLAAGRSAVLYHGAKADLAAETGPDGGYMMPNALKLPETVTETANEFARTAVTRMSVDTIIVSASSATIAAGVFLGAVKCGWAGKLIVHMGYSRSRSSVLNYLFAMSGISYLDSDDHVEIVIVDEGYGYADKASTGVEAPFPCNEFYDLKALRWWYKQGRSQYGSRGLLWNIG